MSVISLNFIFREVSRALQDDVEQYMSGSIYSPSKSSSSDESPERHAKKKRSHKSYRSHERHSTPKRPKKTAPPQQPTHRYVPLSDDETDIDTRIARIGQLTPTSCKIWSFAKEKRLCQLWAEETNLYDFNLKAHASKALRDASLDRISAILDIDGMYEMKLYIYKLQTMY